MQNESTSMSEAMAGGERHVIGAFATDLAAASAERALELAGFSRESISALARQTEATGDAGPAIAAKAAKGALIGGLAAGVMLLPTGLFLVAGPIAAALGGLGGGLLGSFVGLGVAREQAERYERLLASGTEVLLVRVANETQARRAADIMRAYGGHTISVGAA